VLRAFVIRDILLTTSTFIFLYQLLAHENADISSAVVQLFFELTDDEVLTDFPDEANTLIEALVIIFNKLFSRKKLRSIQIVVRISKDPLS
jgi:hypothetical protein